MNQIERLIQERCPNGVKYAPISEVGTVIRGKRFVKDDMTSSGVPCVHYGEIYTKYENAASQSFSYVTEARSRTLRFAQPGDVIMASAGETIEDIGKSFAWVGDDQIAIHDACYSISTDMNPKFVAYFFNSSAFRAQIRRRISSSKISSVSTQSIEKAVIPVPPLALQRAIVEVLDTFSQLEAELEAALEAELEARKQQYEHYRAELLAPRPEDVAVSLNQVAEYSTTRINADTLSSATFIGVDNLLPNKQGKTDATYLPNASRLTAYRPGDVLIGNIRPYLKKVWLADSEGGCSGDVLSIRILDKDNGIIDPAYLYYHLSSDNFFAYNMQHAKGAKMPRGDKKAILSYKFNIPSLERQQQVVDELNQLDALVNNLSVGLPAELQARRQQYEYYRDKLLTFRPLEVAA